jgi:hypothetical protein
MAMRSCGKDGGTFGYSSFIGFNPKTHAGVVVLANEFTSLNDLGLQLLDPRPELRQHRQITLDPDYFDRYAGRYELAPGAIFTVKRDGPRLMVQLTGQPSVEVYPESERDFFYKVVDAALTFEVDRAGRPVALVLHQNGLHQIAKRIEGEGLKERREIAIDAKLLDDYVGRYQLSPDFALTITREGDRLFLQATGQPQLEIYPESNRDFFLKVVDAQVTFEPGPQGRATLLVLHQNGQHQRAPRIE